MAEVGVAVIRLWPHRPLRGLRNPMVRRPVLVVACVPIVALWVGEVVMIGAALIAAMVADVLIKVPTAFAKAWRGE